ncbi:MAG TPA: hypothetical protein VI316_11870 [Candidatus Dormibacteraeota bacterium]
MPDDDATVEPEAIPPGPVAGPPDAAPPQIPASPAPLGPTGEAAAAPEAASAMPAPAQWVVPPAALPASDPPGVPPAAAEAPAYPIAPAAAPAGATSAPASPSLVPGPVHPAQPPSPGGWQAAPGAWPAMPYPSADPTGWYWCPTHLIAAEKEGICPTCGQPYQPAPPWGIPAGPYRPKVSTYHRGTKEKVAYVAAGLVLTAMALGAVFGLTALYRHGTPLDSNGLPVSTAVASGSGGGAVASNSTDTNNSRVVLSSLEGKNLILSGHWTPTTQLYVAMINFAKSLTTDNSQPPLDVAYSKGTTRIAVFNVPTSDPAKIISDHSQSTADSATVTGGVVNVSASQSVTIDGKASNYTDFTTVDSTGKAVFSLRIFFIPTASHVVLVVVGTTDARSDLDTVSQALQTLQ